MNKTYDKAFLKKVEEELVAMQSDILKTIDSEQEVINSILADVAPKDSADLASDDTDKNILQTLSAAEERRVAQIRMALNRIHAGSYGVCSTCGKMINENRLEAMPFAILCLDCQKKSDSQAN
jgi:RNA polymerase-binding protein DksA